jgi:hypothetical protein
MLARPAVAPACLLVAASLLLVLLPLAALPIPSASGPDSPGASDARVVSETASTSAPTAPMTSLAPGGSAIGSAGLPAGAASIPGRLCSGYAVGVPTALVCPSHDEATVSFYSVQAGSGGNVSWNVTLPTDRNPTENQSDLYSAAWFGLPLSDPFGVASECFVEVQFYPDQSYYNDMSGSPNQTANGAWVGAVVGWQVDAQNGVEDACYYEPLYLNGKAGPAYLNMSQGDRIALTLTGWIGSRTGEQVTVTDMANSETSTETLYNSSGNYALDPVYSTNSWQDPTLWAAGGGYPISFGFDLGRSVNGVFASNSSFGGCSPGFGGASDPSAPCASYDPGAWANDTQTPWKISAPVYFNALGRSHSVQVGFDSTVGGVASVGARSDGECSARAASAECSYPWFSYSCSAAAFEFGATDYSGFSTDFGKVGEYQTTPEVNALEMSFYPATNQTVPACKDPSFAVTVHVHQGSSGDTIVFLSKAYSYPLNQTQDGVLPGNYSAGVVAGPGSVFEFWDPVKLGTLSDKGTPTTNVQVTGDGVLVAFFTVGNTIAPNTTAVKFTDSPFGSVGVGPSSIFTGATGGSGDPIATVVNGHSLSLHPGTYAIQAYPTHGYNFTSWSVNDTGVSVAAPGLPVTWLTVTSFKTTASVVAHFTPSTSKSYVTLSVIGNGTASLGTLSVSNTSSLMGSVSVGGWNLTATPGTGETSVIWSYGSGALMTNFSQSTFADLFQGTAHITATFVDRDPVLFVSSPSQGGTISFVGTGGVGPVLQNDTTSELAPGTYTVEANVDPFQLWSGWVASGGISVTSPTVPVTAITVSGAGSLAAMFAKAPHIATVKFGSSPTAAGAVLVDGTRLFTSLGSPTGLSVGLHTISVEPVAGSTFSSWNLTSKVKVVGSSSAIGEVINVTSSGQVEAMMTSSPSPLTFVLVDPLSTGASSVRLTINSVSLATGETTPLTFGSYAAKVTGTKATIQSWTATSNLTLSGTLNATSTVTVSGSGTVYVILTAAGTGSGAGVIAPAPLVPTFPTATVAAPSLRLTRSSFGG